MELTDAVSADREHEQRLLHRRASLQATYEALASGDDSAFWRSAEAPDLPLEVLVRCVRACRSPDSVSRQRRLIEIIIRRTQHENECWAASLLAHLPLYQDERHMLIGDLCADLYECLVRALLDSERHFWEEHFYHCLRYERQHVYRAFMVREGRWRGREVAQGSRVPRTLMLSLERPPCLDDSSKPYLELEDHEAERMLRSVETNTLLSLVLLLPASLRMILLLLFWQELTEKEVARILNITDRTVRTRKRQALEQLRQTLQFQGGLSDGA